MRAHLLLSLAAIALVSCSHYPTPYRDQNGKVAYATQFGGKWQHTINADGSMAFIGDNEISLQHITQMATALGMSYIDYLRYAEEVMGQMFAAGQITKQQYQAGLFKLKELEANLGAGIKSQGIGAGAPLGTVTF